MPTALRCPRCKEDRDAALLSCASCGEALQPTLELVLPQGFAEGAEAGSWVEGSLRACVPNDGRWRWARVEAEYSLRGLVPTHDVHKRLVESWIHDDGPLSGCVEIPFRVSLPLEPTSFQGERFRLIWRLYASLWQAGPDGARLDSTHAAYVSRGFELHPGHAALTDLAARKSAFRSEVWTTRLRELRQTLGWGLLMAFFLFFAVASAIGSLLRPGTASLLGLLIVLTMLLFTGIVFFRLFLPPFKRLLGLALPISTRLGPLHCGDLLEIPGDRARGWGWRLLCVEVEEVLRKRFNKGVDTSYTEWLVHERELARGEGGGEARVPPQGPPSLLIGKRRIKWELRFFRPSAPAIEQCVPLLVLPTRRPR